MGGVLDLVCSLFLLSLLAIMLGGYTARVYKLGRARQARLAGGEGKLLGQPLMEAAYWLMGPVVNGLLAVGATPNGVTVASLLPASAAAVSLALGHFGIAAVFMVMASLCDLVDGVLARRLGITCEAGEVIDATTDRYVEFLILGGLIVHYGPYWPACVLALGALLASFMVSYSTAKAESLQVAPPKGMMRRAERAVYLGAGITFVPVVAWIMPQRLSAQIWFHDLPLLLALALIAVLGNVSAVSRLFKLTALLRQRGQKSRPTSFTTEPLEVPGQTRSRARV